MDITNGISRAVKEQESGNLSAAEGIYSAILLNDPDNPAVLNNLGNLLRAKGDPNKAIECFRKALLSSPSSPELHYNLANILHETGNAEEAIAHYRFAITLAPDLMEAYNNIAGALNEAGRFDEALDYIEKVLTANPLYAGAYITKGNICAALEQWDKALNSYRKALEITPRNHDIFYNMANIKKITGNISEALTLYRETLKLKPDYPDAWNNLGAALKRTGNISEAVECYRKAIDLSPYNEDAHLNYAIALLLSGRFEEGWKEYEWRLKTRNVYRRENQREWNGAKLNGETVLLYADQGYGDTIQCARYIPMVKAMGAGKIILECQPELISLMEKISCIDSISPRKTELVAFDLCCALFSLPLIFDTDLENIPASVPYLQAPERIVSKWKNRLKLHEDMLNVGLVWAGSPSYQEDKSRSLDLKMFLPMLKLKEDNIAFFSLQKGLAAKEILSVPEDLRPTDLSGEIDDFSDTAAIMEQLSLIITVDTASAHLAGALGKPVWTLVPEDPDWRWLLEREDSPWYPTMKLFRRTAEADWHKLVLSICLELKKHKKEQLQR
ncbi:MAG: tetratricopeptide repeat protein [Nitrospirae bacterium]|nr:MAG: tetratricopeptide repeat protein [Nitrospirota bacterium]